METSTPRKQSQKIVLFGAARFFPSHPPPRFTRTVTQLKRDLLFSILLGFLWRGSLIFYKLCFQGLSFVLISGSLTTIWLILLFFFPFCIFCNFPLTMIDHHIILRYSLVQRHTMAFSLPNERKLNFPLFIYTFCSCLISRALVSLLYFLVYGPWTTLLSLYHFSGHPSGV